MKTEITKTDLSILSDQQLAAIQDLINQEIAARERTAKTTNLKLENDPPKYKITC